MTMLSPLNSPPVAAEETEAIEARHRWLLLGAVEKARSVVALARGHDVRTVLEVGAGTGAVLEQLDRQGFADRYYAVEPSEDLLGYMKQRGAIGRLVDAEAATLDRSRLGRARYDLVILSHVLEHVEDPGRLLCDALDVGDLVLLEVPLEGSIFGNLRALARRVLTGMPRRNNTAGHIQFFGHGDVGELVHWCGAEILASRLYVPRAQLWDQLSRDTRLRKAYHRAVLGLSRLAPGPWARFYHGHYAALVRLRPSLDATHRSHWPATNYYERARSGEYPPL